MFLISASSESERFSLNIDSALSPGIGFKEGDNPSTFGLIITAKVIFPSDSLLMDVTLLFIRPV